MARLTLASLCTVLLFAHAGFAAFQLVPNLAVVDTFGDNVMFRGGDAVVNGTFQYDLLVAQMNANYTLPASFRMVVLNFMGAAAGDTTSINIEKSYWVSNPSKGNTTMMPLFGAQYSPRTISDPNQIRTMAMNISAWLDNLPSVISTARELLYTTTTPPTLVYVHCTCGCDRTGEFGISYNMQYKNKTLTQARNMNVILIGREQVVGNLYAAEWYCYYLKYSLNYNLTCVFPDTDAIILPSCMLNATMSLVDIYNVNGVVTTSWVVNTRNFDPINAVNGSGFYSGVVPNRTALGVSFWGVTFGSYPGSISPIMPDILPNQTNQWGYNITGTTPISVLLTSPTVCLGIYVPGPPPVVLPTTTSMATTAATAATTGSSPATTGSSPATTGVRTTTSAAPSTSTVSCALVLLASILLIL